MTIKAIVFDFDGVIAVDSEFEKERAWGVLAKEGPALGPTSVPLLTAARERWAKAKGSRFDILRDVFGAFGHTGDRLEDLVRQYASWYNEIVQNAIIALGVADEDRRALVRLAARAPLFVNSGTPEKAMQETVSRLLLAEHFQGVFGMPATKIENLKRACAAAGVEKENFCFVVDGVHDAETARTFGCPCIGRANRHNEWVAPQPFPLIHALREIEQYLEH